MSVRVFCPIVQALIALSATSHVSAQQFAPAHVVVGSDEENYLRYLQSTGLVGDYPWSLRGFAPAEMPRLAASASHPWSGRMRPVLPSRIRFTALPTATEMRFNSSFPYGSNDGAIWAGRGFTYSIEGGVVFLLGPLSAVVNPIAFRAENRSFALLPNGESGKLAFGHGQFAAFIDLPQRFGPGPYGRIDPGQTTVRLDLFGVAAGVSTASMGWGPMGNYQLILSNNGPGIPHAFVGTSKPSNIGIGRLHARVFWGRLEQSEYSPVTGSPFYSSWLEPGTRRFATGAVAVLQPRWTPGLELGGSRFFHMLWPREGLPRSYFTEVFGSIVKEGVPKSSGLTDERAGNSNQLASVFARWVHRSSKFELYGEYGRDDHNYDWRDFFQEPDHARLYALGFRKVLSSDASRLSGIRAELANYQLPTLGRNRGEGSIYIHNLLTQGHTVRGQPLGADLGVATGAGAFVAWDSFDREGKITISLTRSLRQEIGTFYLDGIYRSNTPDVLYGLTFERTRFLSRFEVTTGSTLVREFNRDFASDAWNLNLRLGLQYRPAQ